MALFRSVPRLCSSGWLSRYDGVSPAASASVSPNPRLPHHPKIGFIEILMLAMFIAFGAQLLKSKYQRIRMALLGGHAGK
ncbi:MAG: hypothetical protein JWR60_3463 [Polaromonas sp.]|nr:hypothetical protein [Polaromonas sp.]